MKRILVLVLLAGCGESVGDLSEGDGQTDVTPSMLGAQSTSRGVIFRVRSARATRLEVWVYDSPMNGQVLKRLQLIRRAGDVWSAMLSPQVGADGVSGPLYYGVRAWGPNWPYTVSWTPGSNDGFLADVDGQGNRFNPNKLVIDPYALELSHDPQNAIHSSSGTFGTGPLYRTIDSGPVAPKGIIFKAQALTGRVAKPTRALKDDIIYEAHLRGLTMNDPSIPVAYRGTYRGAALKAAELAALGVTAVEFLPLQETQNDQNDLDPTSTFGDNYWGYMTLSYFAPDRRYAFDQSPGGPTRELQAMINEYHRHGLKVFVDVVYNHTAEGGPWLGTTSDTYSLFSFRGIDNPSYYSLTSDRQFPWDNTGVGGNFNTHNPMAQDLIVDSLKYWRDVLGVDGYRFDLASVLGNTCEHGCFNFDSTDEFNALNRIVRDLPPRPAAGGKGLDLIAEPWAIGGNSFQVGGFPAGWSEWNGKYRDTLRSDLNKLGVDVVTPGALAMRLAGSADLYGDDGRQPWNSVNVIVTHDGFTLNDLFSYDSKQNEQRWPYGPSEGGEDHNLSWSQGGDPASQRKAARSAFALLLLSAGTPLLTAGDEYLRSQGGNNNPYNVDSNKNWLAGPETVEQQNFLAFAKGMLAFRRAHPALRPIDFYAPADVRWFTTGGLTPETWWWNAVDQHALAWMLDGTRLGDPASAIYVAWNGWSDFVTFALPSAGAGKRWYRVVDTCPWSEGPNQVRSPGNEDLIDGPGIGVCARGVVLLLAK